MKNDIQGTLGVTDRDLIMSRLVAKSEIETALADYAIGIDDRDEERWLSAFHPDAIFDVDFPKATLEGHESILKWANEVFLFHSITHLTGNHRIDIHDDESASGVGRGLGLFKLADGSVTLASARLTDRYEKRLGQWRIAYRKVSITSSFMLTGTKDLILNGVQMI